MLFVFRGDLFVMYGEMKRIIQNRKYAYVFSGLLFGVSILALLVWGLRFGIDFRGGTTLRASVEKEGGISIDGLREELLAKNFPGLSIQTLSDGDILIEYGAMEGGGSDVALDVLRAQDEKAQIVDTRTVGGMISGEMRERSIQAVIVAIIGISLYIAGAFRKVSRPISSWLYGVGALIALAHDVIVTLGAFAFLGYFFGVEVGVPFIAAILTILGYSINDTIVVYDRVRENIFRYGRREDFETVVNRSVNETLTRSVNTSMTVIVVLLAILLFGGESIFYFSLALLIGIIAGTYSSIFIASALLVTFEKQRFIKS